jgi:NAD(P)-dependent dehydrogenase (short-subunit alcohol dehydrogenase family)
MTGPFHGRRVLVTGAAKGIGLATLVRLAAEGARVAALDRDAAALESLPERLGQALGSMSRMGPP